MLLAVQDIDDMVDIIVILYTNLIGVQIQFEQNQYMVPESVGSLPVCIIFVGDVQKQLTFMFSTEDGSATGPNTSDMKACICMLSVIYDSNQIWTLQPHVSEFTLNHVCR